MRAPLLSTLAVLAATLACSTSLDVDPPPAEDEARAPDAPLDDEEPAPDDTLDAPIEDTPAPPPDPVDDGPPIGGEVPVFRELPHVDNPVGRAVSVKPVFVVPAGTAPPTAAERTLFAQHLQLAQARYQEMLGGQDTFEIDAAPDVVALAHDATYYVTSSPEWVPATTALIDELLSHYALDRHRAPFVFVMLMGGEDSPFPGNGMPLNGGFASGGGGVSMRISDLASPNFQSTLQHELGHAFGLPHVDAYGYDMDSNPSIMSYNLGNHTSGLETFAGTLIPEDLMGLDLAELLFPAFTWDGVVDDGYVVGGPIILPPMPLDGRPHAVTVSTTDGEEFDSLASSAVQGVLYPSSASVGYIPSSMWHSAYDLAPGTWVAVDVVLPLPVLLDGLTVSTEHSGLYHRAAAVRVFDLDDGDGDAAVELVTADVATADAYVPVPPTAVTALRIAFQVGETGSITLRGLRFHEGGRVLFPPILDVTSWFP